MLDLQYQSLLLQVFQLVFLQIPPPIMMNQVHKIVLEMSILVQKALIVGHAQCFNVQNA